MRRVAAAITVALFLRVGRCSVANHQSHSPQIPHRLYALISLRVEPMQAAQREVSVTLEVLTCGKWYQAFQPVTRPFSVRWGQLQYGAATSRDLCLLSCHLHLSSKVSEFAVRRCWPVMARLPFGWKATPKRLLTITWPEPSHEP